MQMHLRQRFYIFLGIIQLLSAGLSYGDHYNNYCEHNLISKGSGLCAWSRKSYSQLKYVDGYSNYIQFGVKKQT